MSKSLPGRFPLHKMNRKGPLKKRQDKLNLRAQRADHDAKRQATKAEKQQERET